MVKLSIELPEELGRYVEFIPQADLNAMFADMLRQRIDGTTQPIVVQAPPTNSFDEDKFFSKLESMLAERTVMSATSQPKSKAVIRETLKAAVVTTKEATADDAKGNDVISNFLDNIFK